MMRQRLALAMAVGTIVTLGLSVRLSRPEIHTDELTYMHATLEAMRRGDILPRHHNGALFTNKPPPSLLLTRASFEILGPSPFAARLPSAVAAGATAALICGLAARFFGGPVGALAALLLVLNPGILRVHAFRSATPDSLDQRIERIRSSGAQLLGGFAPPTTPPAEADHILA